MVDTASDNSQELTLAKGELVEVLDQEGNWWIARKADGTEGGTFKSS